MTRLRHKLCMVGAFSVGKTELGPLTGAACDLGKGEPRVVSKELGLRWTPK